MKHLAVFPGCRSLPYLNIQNFERRKESDISIFLMAEPNPSLMWTEMRRKKKKRRSVNRQRKKREVGQTIASMTAMKHMNYNFNEHWRGSNGLVIES